MKSESTRKPKSNRLMQGLIIISLGVHALLFVHIADIYRSEAMSYIELSMQQISKPFQRSIPRPRMRPKAPKIHTVNKLQVRKQAIPRLKIDPMKNSFSDNLMEGIGTPDIPDNAPLDLAGMSIGETAELLTRKDYFEMLMFRIESRKRYPEAAKSDRIEGKVKVSFIITTDGQVSSLKVIKSARHSSLNKSALNAVRDAAPFPRPPAGLFKGPVKIEVSIVFELM